MRRIPMYMKDWLEKLHGFLTLNGREILTHAGKISHELAKQTAEQEYEKYNIKRIERNGESDWDKIIQQVSKKRNRKRAMITKG